MNGRGGNRTDGKIAHKTGEQKNRSDTCQPQGALTSKRLSLPQTAIKTRSSAEAGSKKGHSYRPLQTQFQHAGFSYRQIAREGNAAIYEQAFSHNPNRVIGYEVIRIRRRDGFYIHGRFVEPAEVYPNSEAWGSDGWTLTDRERAFAKLREICQ